MKPLKFKGVYKDYIWGGNRMREKYSVKTDISPLAESWVLSCHPDGLSIISGGEYDGISLSEYLEKNPSVLGTACKGTELPILIKFIDAEDKLSVQVHPDDEMAKKLENQNGKTEMWYVVEANKDASITYGLKKAVTKEELSSAIKENTVENLLNTVKSKKGDVFFVEAGTIHAIGKGNLIAEIQQNSNVTYRLYDYDRRGKDGKPRELHVEKGVEASKRELSSCRNTPLCSDNTRLLGTCEYFSVKELNLSKAKYTLNADMRSYHVLLLTEGSALITQNSEKTVINAGEALFIGAGFGKYTLEGNGTMLLVNNPPKYFVGIDLGGTNIAAAVVDEYGVIYGRAKKKTKAPRPYNEIFDDMAECAREAAKMSGIPFDDIENVGIGCPGSIDMETGSIEFSNNLDFYDVPIVSYMEKALGKKVYVENDANAAAWGEFLAGSGKNYNSMVMITLGTGVGSGIIYDGRLLTGSFGKGAEIGHTSLISGGEKCTCGRRGCFEAYASATALIRQTKEAMRLNPDSDMWKVCKGKISNADGRTAFLAKDKAAKEVVRNYLTYLADGIVDVINILQPEILCIGGGISHEGEKILKPIKRRIEKYSYARFSKKQTDVTIASLGNDAGIIGAALLYKNN